MYTFGKTSAEKFIEKINLILEESTKALLQMMELILVNLILHKVQLLFQREEEF